MTKNFQKVLMWLGFTGLTLAALVVAPVGAVNLGDAQLAQADETANAGYQAGGADVAKALNLSFTGLTQAGATSASTGAYVTISATAMTFYQPYLTLDTSVGTSGVITYASTLASNTLGALCDYLNGLGRSYKCTLISAKRDDPAKVLTTQTETDGTNNLAAVGGFNATQTTTTYVSLGIIPGANRRVVLKQVIVNGNMAAGDSGLQIYGQLRKYGAVAPAPVNGVVQVSAKDPFGTVADDTYKVWSSTHVTSSAITVPSSNALPRWIEFAQGAHVVVRDGNTGSTSVQTGSNFVQASWDER